jgi:hypothetical protein
MQEGRVCQFTLRPALHSAGSLVPFNSDANVKTIERIRSRNFSVGTYFKNSSNVEQKFILRLHAGEARRTVRCGSRTGEGGFRTVTPLIFSMLPRRGQLKG